MTDYKCQYKVLISYNIIRVTKSMVLKELNFCSIGATSIQMMAPPQ